MLFTCFIVTCSTSGSLLKPAQLSLDISHTMDLSDQSIINGGSFMELSTDTKGELFYYMYGCMMLIRSSRSLRPSVDSCSATKL